MKEHHAYKMEIGGTPPNTPITIENLEAVMNKEVRPKLQLHGGGVEIVELKDNILSVRLLGQCNGCPSADLTMRSIIEESLKAVFPDLSEIKLVAGVSEDLLAQAVNILRKNK